MLKRKPPPLVVPLAAELFSDAAILLSTATEELYRRMAPPLLVAVFWLMVASLISKVEVSE